VARGGARTGAGRKPKRQPLADDSNLVVFDGGKAGDVSKTPPVDLPEDQRPFWQQYAPLAMERRTLTPHTVPAFRQLCELEAMKAKITRQLNEDGLTSGKVTTDVTSGEQHLEIKPHPLLRAFSSITKDIKGLLKDFALCSFGKPVVGGSKSKADQAKAALRTKFFGARG
jgi:Phage terminase, small subunit